MEGVRAVHRAVSCMQRREDALVEIAAQFIDVRAGDDASLGRRIVVVTCVAIPIFVAFWVGIIALAVSFTNAGFAAPLAMGAGVGVLAGGFWGGWYGFVAYSRHEEAERRARRSSGHD